MPSGGWSSSIGAVETVERYRRGSRWLHAGISPAVLVSLATGWWFVIDGYRHRSPLGRLTGLPDTAIHVYAGYATIGVLALWLLGGARGLRGFLRETLRWRRGDARWLAGFPRAAF